MILEDQEIDNEILTEWHKEHENEVYFSGIDWGFDDDYENYNN